MKASWLQYVVMSVVAVRLMIMAKREDIIYTWSNEVVGLPQYYKNFIQAGYNAKGSIKKMQNELYLIEIDIYDENHQKK